MKEKIPPPPLEWLDDENISSDPRLTSPDSLGKYLWLIEQHNNKIVQYSTYLTKYGDIIPNDVRESYKQKLEWHQSRFEFYNSRIREMDKIWLKS